MSATLEHWFSGGARDCRTCADDGEPCARGGRYLEIREHVEGAGTLKVCPQFEHAPHTLAGHLVLDLVREGAVLRTGFNGIEGLDTREALARLAGRIAEPDALHLLDAAEQGVMSGVGIARERRRGEGG